MSEKLYFIEIRQYIGDRTVSNKFAVSKDEFASMVSFLEYLPQVRNADSHALLRKIQYAEKSVDKMVKVIKEAIDLQIYGKSFCPVPVCNNCGHPDWMHTRPLLTDGPWKCCHGDICGCVKYEEKPGGLPQ